MKVVEMLKDAMPVSLRRELFTSHFLTILLSLVHTVPVYAPVRPGSLQPADRGEP